LFKISQQGCLQLDVCSWQSVVVSIELCVRKSTTTILILHQECCADGKLHGKEELLERLLGFDQNVLPQV
jgi:hypothetical protein